MWVVLAFVTLSISSPARVDQLVSQNDTVLSLSEVIEVRSGAESEHGAHLTIASGISLAPKESCKEAACQATTKAA